MTEKQLQAKENYILTSGTKTSIIKDKCKNLHNEKKMQSLILA